MINSVHRLECEVAVIFKAPRHVTFGWQQERKAFSVWYRSDEKYTCYYVILGTGHETKENIELVASVVVPDGFHVFHLCRILQG